MCVAMVSTFPPDRCGIGRFTWSLAGALNRVPGVSVEIARLVGPFSPPADPTTPVVMEFDPDSPVSVQVAARRLGTADAVVVQHEFGIYGGDDGAAVVNLVDAIAAPVTVVLHTVLPEPSPNQHRIIQALARSADTLIALSSSAEDLLISRYSVDPAMVTVIPHGSQWAPLPVVHRPRRNLLTWGLLGPGKGIERAIAAVAGLRSVRSEVVYRIVGQIHPSVLRHSGQAYRHHLEGLVRNAGLDGQVVFDDRYQSERDLLGVVADSDIVLLPYDNREQICSGVLTEAVAAGKPVVATAFPHAIEMLGSGSGFVVDHDHPTAMTDALTTLMTDELAYRRAAGAATQLGTTLSWDTVAHRYADLLARQLTSQSNRADVSA